MASDKPDAERPGDGEQVAGGGLLHRRLFLSTGGAALGVLGVGGLGLTGLGGGVRAAAPLPSSVPPAWMTTPGAPLSPYGSRARASESIQRILTNPPPPFPGTGSSRTPLHLLEGTITPNGLHFERHHNGVPDIDPDRHELLVHGLVRQPLTFRYQDLLRYPLESRIMFIECSGNSGALSAPKPAQINAGQLNGLVSCAEWTGVRLSTLLEDAGLLPQARWIQAEGADAAALTRSIPVAICLDDAMVALYQNGEPLRPEQGFPMRLLLPGIEGNASVKWLRRLDVMARPALSREETAKYTDLLRDGSAEAFSLRMGVKSVILRPSFGLDLPSPGLQEISGLAWSGRGRIRKVEVSADGGASWAEAALGEPVLPCALTRFRIPWRWTGGPVTLMSRASDDTGAVQPRRDDWLAKYAPGQGYHNNSIQAWRIDAAGRISHVYV